MSINEISVRENPVLTRIAKGFSPDGFVAGDILPDMTVRALQGKVNEYGSEAIRIHSLNVTFDSLTPVIKMSVTKIDGWEIKPRAVQALITQGDAANQFPGNPEQGRRELREVQTKNVRHAIMVGRENALMTTLTTTGNYIVSNTVTLSGTSQYDDYTNSDPIGDFKTARLTIWDNVFQEANAVVMPFKVAETLRFHPDLIARMSNDVDKQKGLSQEQLRNALGVEELLISKAIKNTAAESQTKVIAQIMPNDVVFFYKDRNPQMAMPRTSLGYSFVFKPLSVDRRFVDDPKDAEFIRVEEQLDDVILSFSAAYLIKDAI